MSKHSPDADVAFISALAELLNKNELTELSVKREYGEDDSLEVRVVKQANVVTVAAAAPAPVHYAPAAAAPAAAPAPKPEDLQSTLAATGLVLVETQAQEVAAHVIQLQTAMPGQTAQVFQLLLAADAFVEHRHEDHQGGQVDARGRPGMHLVVELVAPGGIRRQNAGAVAGRGVVGSVGG